MKDFVSRLCMCFVLLVFVSCTAKAQTVSRKPPPEPVPVPKIPEEFWDFPLKYFELGYALNYSRPLKTIPTPRMLFKQMKFRSEKQLDGTERKNELVKTALKGNDIVFTIKMTLPPKEIFVDIAVTCNMESKSNHISSFTIYDRNESDNPVRFTPIKTGDSFEYTQCELFYKDIFKFIGIWYGWDEFHKYQ